MQGVRGGEHLPAPAPQEHMQGVRGGEHLPAPAPKEQMQGVRGGGHVPAKKKTQEQRESMCTKSSKELPHKSVTQVSRGELQDIKRAKVAQLRAILRTSRHAHKRQSPGAPQKHVQDDLTPLLEMQGAGLTPLDLAIAFSTRDSSHLLLLLLLRVALFDTKQGGFKVFWSFIKVPSTHIVLTDLQSSI